MPRHCTEELRTEGNVTHDTGLYDPSLTEDGIRMCSTLAEKDSLPKVEILISSTSTRAIQTAQLLYPNQKIYATTLFLEYNTGAACNMSSTPESRLDKKIFNEVDFERFSNEPLPRETTFEDGYKRAKLVEKFLQELKEEYQEIAVVTHANFTRTLLTCLGKSSPGEIHNCDIVTIEI